eukprot:6488066-Pyramimonas_sp.AAC.1
MASNASEAWRFARSPGPARTRATGCACRGWSCTPGAVATNYTSQTTCRDAMAKVAVRRRDKGTLWRRG